jgi:putative addiction module killer protein
MEILRYVTAAGQDVFGEWLGSLKDKQAAARVAMRINRLAAGNFGDCKALRDGVWELRIDHGPGYRVYYAKSGRTCILLLCGGDKRKQTADINRAIEYWQDFQRRNENGET